MDVATVAGVMTRAFDALSDHHEVRWEVEEELRVWVDPMALSQVLGHLLDNAVKFSPNGGVVLVSGRCTTGAVEIFVVDQGLGLPKGIDVFQPFQQGEQDVVPGPGVGLGLHILRSLVEASGGSVTATPNAVAGSTFTVRLPSRRSN